MNGSNGIQPTIELATTNGNGYYPYPVMYGNGNNGGFFGGDGWIALIILALLFNNGWGGFGGGNNNDYAWLSNGQKDIMTNTNNGFDTLHLSNQLEGNRDAINGLSNQLCNSVAAINSNISDGFYGLNTSFLNCCCENRLGLANLNSTIISENCADRQALNEGVRDIIANQTAGTQRILDQLCNDKIDAKNEKILDLQRQLDMADLKASQTAQNAFIAQGLNNEVDALYNRLATCPINTIPVYGNQRIFTCPGNNGCGCNGNYYNVI